MDGVIRVVGEIFESGKKKLRMQKFTGLSVYLAKRKGQLVSSDVLFYFVPWQSLLTVVSLRYKYTQHWATTPSK